MPKLAALAGAIVMTVATAAAAQVRVERVEFASGGERLVGMLHIPEGAGPDRPAPALVVTGAWMTVKEQMPARYAREMAERGFLALAFDFRGWGESGGVRRQVEDPAAKIEDIGAAVAFLAAHPEADGSQVGALGICASAGYVAHAAAAGPAIRSVALVAPWLHDRGIVEATYGGTEGVARLLTVGDAAEAEFRRSGRQALIPAASTTDERALMFGVPYYTDSDRGMIPAWRNEVDPAFWRGWLTFDAIAAAPRLRQPLLLVHSEAAAIPQGARRFLAQAIVPKRDLWLADVTQFDFYDRDVPVRAAADAVAEHFRATLGGAQPR